MFKKIYKYGEREAFCLYRDGITQKHELKDLFWECTLNCNLRCKHCGSFAGNKRLPDELTTEEIKTAFQKIARGCDPGKILINVTGGEPLMRPDLCDVMGYAANELGFHWGMTTNGMLLTENNIQKLKEAGLATVAVSIDGMPQTHDAFRGCEGSYKTVVENIARLRDAGFLRHLQVSTVFHKSNIDELEPLYNEINKLRINSWRLITVDPIGRAEQNADILLSGPEIKRILDFIKADGYPARPKQFTCDTLLSYLLEELLYKGVDEDATTVSVRATLIASTEVSEDDVYNLLKAMFDNKDDLVAGHAKFEFLNLEDAVAGISVPFHPGAVKYFAEQGIEVE